MFQIDGFDELFLALDKELEGEDRYSSQDALAGQSRHIPAFDERVIESATLDDLDLDLALTVMREYCVKLKRAPVTRDTLLPLMREQGLVIHETGTDKVSAGAILLFGKNTQAFFLTPRSP
jgi:predicted HTH transcriptional regulator